MKKFRGYIFSRPFLGERVPQSVQNLVIHRLGLTMKIPQLYIHLDNYEKYRIEFTVEITVGLNKKRETNF